MFTVVQYAYSSSSSSIELTIIHRKTVGKLNIHPHLHLTKNYKPVAHKNYDLSSKGDGNSVLVIDKNINLTWAKLKKIPQFTVDFMSLLKLSNRELKIKNSHDYLQNRQKPSID